MSTLTLQRGEKDPDLSDTVPEVKTSIALQRETEVAPDPEPAPKSKINPTTEE